MLALSNEPPMTFYFAPEIEVSAISILWREPARLAEFLRVCDPLVHLTQPHLRIILESIGIAYGELNTADWATVSRLCASSASMRNAEESLDLTRFTGQLIRGFRIPTSFLRIRANAAALRRAPEDGPSATGHSV